MDIYQKSDLPRFSSGYGDETVSLIRISVWPRINICWLIWGGFSLCKGAPNELEISQLKVGWTPHGANDNSDETDDDDDNDDDNDADDDDDNDADDDDGSKQMLM